MKVKLESALISKPGMPQSATKVKTANFSEILQQKPAENPKNMPLPDLFTDIQNIQKAILNGKEFSGKDLIMYQIKTGQYSMKVELISKVAESAVSTVKKFQNPQ